MFFFEGNHATLKLDAPNAFKGLIYNVAIGDTLDLAGINATSVTYTYSSSTLTVNESNGQQLNYIYNVIGGSVEGSVLTAESDKSSGTNIYWVPQPETWIAGAGGDWSAGTDWLSGAVPSSTDDAVINNLNSNIVSVNEAAVALR